MEVVPNGRDGRLVVLNFEAENLSWIDAPGGSAAAENGVTELVSAAASDRET